MSLFNTGRMPTLGCLPSQGDTRDAETCAARAVDLVRYCGTKESSTRYTREQFDSLNPIKRRTLSDITDIGTCAARRRWLRDLLCSPVNAAKGVRTMTDNILRYFQECSFDPRTIQVMDSAYERACRSLHDLGQPDLVKEIIARRIIEVAQTGERDVNRLCERALVALGFHERT
jgi:hypothetical protein